jgi:hypothetical protein
MRRADRVRIPMAKFYCLMPWLDCKNLQADPRCEPILLPAGNLRAADWAEAQRSANTDQQEWPPDGWSATFGCTSCGFVSEYFAPDVQWNQVQTQTTGLRHSGANCFAIEFECARGNCGAHTTLHVSKLDSTEADIEKLVASPFFRGSLPCGHDITSLAAVPHEIRKAMSLSE